MFAYMYIFEHIKQVSRWDAMYQNSYWAAKQQTSWVIARWWFSVSPWRICITFVWPRGSLKLTAPSSRSERHLYFASITLCLALLFIISIHFPNKSAIIFRTQNIFLPNSGKPSCQFKCKYIYENRIKDKINYSKTRWMLGKNASSWVERSWNIICKLYDRYVECRWYTWVLHVLPYSYN